MAGLAGFTRRKTLAACWCRNRPCVRSGHHPNQLSGTGDFRADESSRPLADMTVRTPNRGVVRARVRHKFGLHRHVTRLSTELIALHVAYCARRKLPSNDDIGPGCDQQKHQEISHLRIIERYPLISRGQGLLTRVSAFSEPHPYWDKNEAKEKDAWQRENRQKTNIWILGRSLQKMRQKKEPRNAGRGDQKHANAANQILGQKKQGRERLL
jgi:hypothetical protein